MVKKRLLLLLMIMALLPLSSVSVNAENPDDIELEAGYVDPNEPLDPDHRSPIIVPHVGINGFSLIFYTSCDGCILRLLDENENVIYTTMIPVGTSTLVLPSYLSGNYRIEIIPGTIYFWGNIEV